LRPDMLYHVPDIHIGLSELNMVLKPDGIFYCATYGEHGIILHSGSRVKLRKPSIYVVYTVLHGFLGENL
jgi:SAM-dependent methyltransferase